LVTSEAKTRNGKGATNTPHRHVRKPTIIVLVEHIKTSQKRGDMNAKLCSCGRFLWRCAYFREDSRCNPDEAYCYYQSTA